MGRSYQRQRGAKRYRHKPGRILFKTVGPFVAIAVAGIFSVAGGSIPALTSTLSLDSLKAMAPGSGCNIKGNISIGTGNKIYHLPGMEDYEITVIDPDTGERWFCTESEAIANGWRKAPR